MKYYELFYLFVGLAVFLMGCEKRNPSQPPSIIPGMSGTVVGITSPLPSITIVAAGQSNMEGWGQAPAQQNTAYPSDPRITVVGVNSVYGNWGPAYEFARDAVKRNMYSSVKILQCSVGGSAITSWQPGAVNYNNCMALWQAQGSPKIGALLWMQGEAEGMTGDMSLVTPWPQEFQQAMSAMRATLASPPLLWAQIGPNPGNPSTNSPDYISWGELQQEQASIDLPNSYMVITSDCGPLEDDWLHFGITGYTTIGDRMFNAFQSLKG